MDAKIIATVVLLATALGISGVLFLKRAHFFGFDNSQGCPCEEAAFCERIRDTTRKEIFVFTFKHVQDSWKYYNWDKVTTVVMAGYLDINLVCWAHKYGARAVVIASVETSVLPNKTARAEWIDKQLDIVDNNYLDGVNFDYENAILADQFDLRNGYTDLVRETSLAFKTKFPYSVVTVDVAWSPSNIDLRYYDYVGLSEASDFLFVMGYDERSQILGDCIAGPNSGFSTTMSGVQGYLDLNIPADRLVLGVPWYGYVYPCISLSKDNVCSIKQVPFRGVNCSDAAGKEFDYSDVIRMLANSTSGRLYDKDSESPYFNYLNQTSGVMLQVWYDDPASLGIKYMYAVDQNLRGVGMWHAEGVNYTSGLPDDIRATREMWDALPDYRRH